MQQAMIIDTVELLEHVWAGPPPFARAQAAAGESDDGTGGSR
jgi:hypothetical protein